ncbi:MAG: site-specific DNA-methyltransferase [Candidatus Dormibacteraeota bacterium]|nr:site-specific DNA-methyltransferase [Candidatus Dormibacteraeota bacterium]
MSDLPLSSTALPLRVEDLTRDQLLELLEADGEGGIRINFAGKSNARRLARLVRPRITRNIAKLAYGPATERARNTVIEGDNLQSMVTLYKERGHVDLVLADPPYNTGNDFRYNDRWDEDPNDPGLGDFVPLDDGARHTKWMRFMWPRLRMMKSMLKPGGVLAICIDHRELFRLGQMLDEPELFGQENRLGIINWQKSYAPRNDNKHLSTATEYVLIYAKDISKTRTGLLGRTDAMNAKYTNPDNDPEGLWRPGDASAGKGRTNQGMVYAIQSPFTGELHYPPPTGCWRMAQNTLLQTLREWGVQYELRALEDDEIRARLLSIDASELKPAKAVVLAEPLDEARRNAEAKLAIGAWPRIYFGPNGQGRPTIKRYFERVKKGVVPMTYWADEDYDIPEELGATSWEHEESGHSQTGIRELDAIVGPNHGFATVKPMRLFEKIIQLWCPPEGFVLDPFGGSGTTGHAVLGLNYLTGARRRFAIIEQGRPERGDSYAQTLTAERLRRAASGEWANGQGVALGGGFSFVKLGKKVDAGALLRMERDEMLDTVIASYFDVNSRRGDQLVRIDNPKHCYRYLIAHNSQGEGFFLVWDGPAANTDLTESVYEACAAEAARAELKAVPYHVYARLYRYQTEGVRFYQIPDRILADFGLDMRSEPFTDESPDE